MHLFVRPGESDRANNSLYRSRRHRVLQATIIESKGGKYVVSNGSSSDGEVRTIASKGLELSMFQHIVTREYVQ